MAGKRGWPKGKPRGPASPERAAALRKMAILAHVAKRKRMADMAGPGINVTPGAWCSALQHIGDSQFVDDGLDEVMLRALGERLVYAGSACCHHETPLQDITIEVIAAVDRTARKNGRKPLGGLPKGLKPERPIVKVRKITLAVAPVPMAKRGGTPLTAVVEELFSREGKPLLEVVSELFDP